VADGPRESKPDDARLCAEVRAIFDEIDWECEVSRNFAETNMGSFKRNSTGLDWVFETVEEAIILEDDCIPSLSFFPYCEELLERYRDDERVQLVSGTNFDFSRPTSNEESYFFSLYGGTWGWASWCRAWQQVDLSMSWWEPESGKELLKNYFSKQAEWEYWFQVSQKIHTGERKNGWDYQMLLTCIRCSQCRTVPKINLITNIGFGIDATHCKDESISLSAMNRGDLEFPLVHPDGVKADPIVDQEIFFTHYLAHQPSLWSRVKHKICSRFK